MNRTYTAALAAALGLACGCKGDQAPARDQPAATRPAEPAAVALEAATLPLEPLARVAVVGDRDLRGDCAGASAATDAIAAAAAAARATLSGGVDTTTGPAALDQLAAALRRPAEALEVADDDSELARTQGELVAAIRDLAEATTGLASALRDRDEGAAGGARLRLDNGVDNLSVTLDRLELLCGS